MFGFFPLSWSDLLRYSVMPSFAVYGRRGTKASSLNQRTRGKYYPEGLNGKRAVARRLRQIEAGALRRENGLVA